jgi:hypothetical protein
MSFCVLDSLDHKQLVCTVSVNAGIDNATHLRKAAARPSSPRPATLLRFQKHYKWDAAMFDMAEI